MSDAPVAEFLAALFDAVAWVRSGRAANSLRSTELCVRGTRNIDRGSLPVRASRLWTGEEAHRDAMSPWLAHEVDRPALVRDVVNRRREILRRDRTHDSVRFTDLRALLSGELLVYFADLTDHDGLSEHESAGFFDYYDAPPWDLWVAYVADPYPRPHLARDSYVIAWVPPDRRGVAKSGMDVECVGCLAWLWELDRLRVCLPIPPWLRPWMARSHRRAGHPLPRQGTPYSRPSRFPGAE